MSRVLVRLDALDLALYRRAAAADTPLLDRVLPPLTRAADHGVLWTGIGIALGLSGAARRRAALRGLLCLSLASATTNIPAKLLADRPRPDLRPVPVPRRLLRQPQTSSFPSGHSASAAAFATGVALEQPLLALPVALLATGVAYGRVHTGVHYPADVAVGMGVGVVAALAVRRAWPVRPEQPAAALPTRRPAPALPDGEGLVVVVNERAGAGHRADELECAMQRLLPRCEVVRVGAEGDVAAELQKAAERAVVLGVAGGDGTVSCAATIAYDAQLPLAVFPGGTLDHFAAELGIGGVEDTVEALRAGSAVAVTLASSDAEGDGGYFLNTFALGVYPELVKEREKHEQLVGKWPALAYALLRVLRHAQPVYIEVDGHPRRLWTLFAGNGHYHPAGFAPSWRERLDDGCIDVRLVDADQSLARVRLAVAVLTGKLGRSRVHEQRIVAKLVIRSRQGGLRVARDGEAADGHAHLLLRAASRPLVVYRPDR